MGVWWKYDHFENDMAHKEAPASNDSIKHTKAHPGFKSVQSKIQGEGYSKKSAGAILAASSRGASKAAHKSNPRLNRVKGR